MTQPGLKERKKKDRQTGDKLTGLQESNHRLSREQNIQRHLGLLHPTNNENAHKTRTELKCYLTYLKKSFLLYLDATSLNQVYLLELSLFALPLNHSYKKCYCNC